MDLTGMRRLNNRLRFPIRHKKSTHASDTEPPPPSYQECSKFFYAPPSYEEIAASESARRRPVSSQIIHRVSWGSVNPTTYTSWTPRVPTAPPLSPLPQSSRNAENLSQRRHSSNISESIVSNLSARSNDVIARIQPRLRSWTQCLRWVVQYTLESNFKNTLAYFKCFVSEGIRIAQQHPTDSQAYPIHLSSLAIARPTTLSVKTWAEIILCMGFKFSQSPTDIRQFNSNNNNNNNNNSNGDDVILRFLTNVFENANNNNSNMCEELGRLCVMVPRDLSLRRLMKYRDNLTALLELPYSAIKTAANMSRTETDRIITLLVQLHHAPIIDDALPVDHALVRSICDMHRRPGFFLKCLDFSEFRPKEGVKLLKIPTGEVARRRFQLAKEVLDMFLRN